MVKGLILLALFCCSANIYNVEAVLAHGKFHNDAHPGKCFISEKVIISPGETVKSPTDCARISCDSADGAATIAGCGAVSLPDGCEWGDYVDVHAPYPECCERHKMCVAK